MRRRGGSAVPLSYLLVDTAAVPVASAILFWTRHDGRVCKIKFLHCRHDCRASKTEFLHCRHDVVVPKICLADTTVRI
jgi:hypothetical protein